MSFYVPLARKGLFFWELAAARCLLLAPSYLCLLRSWVPLVMRAMLLLQRDTYPHASSDTLLTGLVSARTASFPSSPSCCMIRGKGRPKPEHAVCQYCSSRPRDQPPNVTGSCDHGGAVEETRDSLAFARQLEGPHIPLRKAGCAASCSASKRHKIT